MKYRENLILYEKDKFISTKKNEFNSFEKAVEDSDVLESGFVEIEILNKSHSDKIPDNKVTYREAIKRNKFAESRYIIISPNKDEIYGEYFILEGADYYFDYNILYGKTSIYRSKDKVNSTLFGESIIANNICRVNGESISEDLSIDELLDRKVSFRKADIMVMYFRVTKNDQNGEIWEVDLLPSSTIK